MHLAKRGFSPAFRLDYLLHFLPKRLNVLREGSQVVERMHKSLQMSFVVCQNCRRWTSLFTIEVVCTAAKFTIKIRRVNLWSVVSSPLAWSMHHVRRSSCATATFSKDTAEIDCNPHRLFITLFFSILSTSMNERCKMSQAVFDVLRDHRDQRVNNPIWPVSPKKKKGGLYFFIAHGFKKAGTIRRMKADFITSIANRTLRATKSGFLPGKLKA